MQIVLAEIIKTDITNQTVDAMEFATGNIYRNIELDSEVNLQQMPETGAIAALLLDGIQSSTTQKLIKFWGTGRDYRRDLEENEIQIQCVDPTNPKSGSYMFLDRNGNVEISDGSYRNSIRIDQEKTAVITESENFYFTNFNGIEIRGLEDGTLVLENTNSNTKIEINNKGKITIQSSEEIEIDGKEIKLGFASNQFAILGNLFMNLYNNHSHPSAVGPTGPPLMPMTEKFLSSKVKVE